MRRPRSFPRRRRLTCAALFWPTRPDRRNGSFDLLASGRIDGYFKGRVTMESAAKLDRNISPEQLVLADRLKEAGVLDLRFNWAFFTAPDASDTRPEAAGLGVAILGSAYMMLIVLALSLPIGVAASIYLEEFAPQNRWTDLIEVNIANLAAVPSIVFGILGWRCSSTSSASRSLLRLSAPWC
jgi:phosphate transport system permease protein